MTSDNAVSTLDSVPSIGSVSADSFAGIDSRAIVSLYNALCAANVGMNFHATVDKSRKGQGRNFTLTARLETRKTPSKVIEFAQVSEFAGHYVTDWRPAHRLAFGENIFTVFKVTRLDYVRVHPSAIIDSALTDDQRANRKARLQRVQFTFYAGVNQAGLVHLFQYRKGDNGATFESDDSDNGASPFWKLYGKDLGTANKRSTVALLMSNPDSNPEHTFYGLIVCAVTGREFVNKHTSTTTRAVKGESLPSLTIHGEYLAQQGKPDKHMKLAHAERFGYEWTAGKPYPVF